MVDHGFAAAASAYAPWANLCIAVQSSYGWTCHSLHPAVGSLTDECALSAGSLGHLKPAGGPVFGPWERWEYISGPRPQLVTSLYS